MTNPQTASFLPLMSIQSHRRPIGYSMPVRQYASASDATAQSNAARARLRNIVARPEVRASNAASAAHARPPEPVAITPDTAPLNMHGACSWRFLVRLASLRHGLSVEEVMRRCRQRHIIAARTEAIELVYRHTQYSMPGIGRLFELDHTSILNALIKTGSTDKLVEVLPHMDTAKRSKNRAGIVIAKLEMQHA